MNKRFDFYHGRDFNECSVPDNATPYEQGRADQRHADLVVGLVCLFVLALFVVLAE